jgi:hypothetical protein
VVRRSAQLVISLIVGFVAGAAFVVWGTLAFIGVECPCCHDSGGSPGYPCEVCGV